MKFFSLPSKLQTILFSALLITSIFFLFLFPVRTTTTIWNGYRVLSCDLSIEENQVTNLLDSLNIHDYVSQSSSMLKSYNTFIPVHPLIEKANYNRLSWFIDVDNNVRYFYIPDSTNLSIKIKKAFSDITKFWNLEDSVGFTSIPVILTLVLICMLLIIPGNRLVRLIIVLPSILLSWSLNTFFGYITAICSVIFISFFGILLPDSKIELLPAQKTQRIRNHPELILSSIILFIFSGIGGLHSILLTFFSLIASLSLIIILKTIHLYIINALAKKRLHKKFTPIAMHPQTIKALHSKKFFILSSSLFLFFVLIGFPFFINLTKTAVSTNKTFLRELCIPSPTGYNDVVGFTVSGFKKSRENKSAINLPDLGDYVSLQWQLEAAPWVKIGEPVTDPQEGSFIEIFEYSMQDNGMLISTVTGSLTFNNRFISKVLDSNLTPLEQMLQKQGRFVSAHIMRLQ